MRSEKTKDSVKTIEKRPSSPSFFARLFGRTTSPIKREKRPDQSYVVMTDMAFLKHKITLDTIDAVQSFAEDIGSKDKWIYTNNSRNYDHLISLISGTIDEEIKRKSQDEINAIIFGHGSLEGIVYSGSSSKSSVVIPLPEFMRDIALKTSRRAQDQRLGFYFSGCNLGVGIGSTSQDPEKIARREKLERELQEKMPDNTVCLVGSGNEPTLIIQNEEILEEIVQQRYTILEKALLSVSRVPQTFKLAYKDKKGRLFTHKSNFILPKDDQPIDAEYAKQQIRRRISEIISFANEAKFEQSEINALNQLAQEIEKELTDQYAYEYLNQLVFQKASLDNKRLDFIWSKLDDNAKRYIYAKKSMGINTILLELFGDNNYKTLLTILDDKSNGFDLNSTINFNINGVRFSGSLNELRQKVADELELQKNTIKKFIDFKKQQGVKKIVLDEKMLLLVDTQSKRDLLQSFLEESRKAGLSIEVYVSEQVFKNHEKNLTEIISDKAEFRICKSEEEKANQIEILARDKTVLNCTDLTRALALDDIKLETVEELFLKIAKRGTQGIIIDAQAIKDEPFLIEFLSFAKEKHPEIAKNIVVFFSSTEKYNNFMLNLPEDMRLAAPASRPRFFRVKTSFEGAVSEYLANAQFQSNIDIFCTPESFRQLSIPKNKSLIPVAREFNYSTLFLEAHLSQHSQREARVSPAPSPSSDLAPRQTSAIQLSTQQSVSAGNSGNSSGDPIGGSSKC